MPRNLNRDDLQALLKVLPLQGVDSDGSNPRLRNLAPEPDGPSAKFLPSRMSDQFLIDELGLDLKWTQR